MCDEVLDTSITIGISWPIVCDQDCADGNGADRMAGLDQGRIVRAGQRRGQIVGLQLFGKRHRQQPESFGSFRIGHRAGRPASDEYGCGDLPGLNLLQRVALAHIDFDRLEAEPFEDVTRRKLSARADIAEIHLLAVKLLDRGDAGIRTDDEMHFFVVELGDIGERIVDIAELSGLAKRVENDRLRDAEVDAFQIADVTHVLRATLSDNGENAETIVVIEYGRQIIRDRQVSPVWITRDDCDRIGVDGVAVDGFGRLPCRTGLRVTQVGYGDRTGQGRSHHKQQTAPPVFSLQNFSHALPL